jgi:hypothetical protein
MKQFSDYYRNIKRKDGKILYAILTIEIKPAAALETKTLTFLSRQFSKVYEVYSKCHVTSNKAKSNLECAEEKFQTRWWVQGCEK